MLSLPADSRFISKEQLLYQTRPRHFSLVLPVPRTYDDTSSSATHLRLEIEQMTWGPVYRFVQRIPRGKVLTYGALARALRLPGGARTAGRAMAATPSGKGIPWHRVVGERGEILIRNPAYASLQKKLLESEGVSVIEWRVNLKRHLWKPPKAARLKDKSPRRRIRG